MAKSLSHGTMKDIGFSWPGGEEQGLRIVKPPLCTTNDEIALERQQTASPCPQS